MSVGVRVRLMGRMRGRVRVTVGERVPAWGCQLPRCVSMAAEARRGDMIMVRVIKRALVIRTVIAESFSGRDGSV